MLRKKKIVLTAVCISGIVLSVAASIAIQFHRAVPTSLKAHSSVTTYILDAGHGGIDGGAVGVHNELEKDINLSITQTLNQLLRSSGCQTIMTRTEDTSIHDPQYTSVRQQKASDIKNRLKIAEETPNAVFVSIHLNYFQQGKYHGAQMFYGSKNPESALLAETLQQEFRSQLQPENQRETKKAGSNLYILSRATCPAVLAECGFLSNPEEATLLSTSAYQRQVAFTIYSALMKYQDQDSTKEEKEVFQWQQK